ncbi:hypothetical protein [Prosthecobacter sp.]|uniref:hypothetical protein n=1 Tax=Prosthecobacter sp. TaxID=1965333 RepID=UPI003784D743
MHRLLLILLMGLFSFLFGSRTSAEPPAAKSKAEEAGRGLRQMMLTMPPAEMGGKPAKDFPHVYGVLLDWPVSDSTATIFAASDGSASLYTTRAFGILGGIGHENVRTAAVKFTRAAGEFFETAKPVTEFPYPAPGQVHFYLLTFDGVRCIEADLAAIENGTSRHTALFVLGQNVLTELRIITEKKQ